MAKKIETTDNNVARAGRPLRILIVDDNHINLSVLSTLLKRRFAHIIDGAPVTVDSGLKAIQLLRTHVFDCILMDIQMPFLSGLDASRRIRNADDGILPANSGVHIVAVTTAVGDEPEAAYRRAGMDGMIGKPVRFHQMQQYLCPLANEAHLAAHSIAPFDLCGEMIMPPLPPASMFERVFYLPADATIPASRPDICEGADFELLLKAQTRASLQVCQEAAITRTVNLVDTPQWALELYTPNVRLDDNLSTSISSRSNSSSSLEKLLQPESNLPTTPPSLHSRSASMTISQRTLKKQIAREVLNAQQNTVALDHNTGSKIPTSPVFKRKDQVRPAAIHHISSPAWMLSEDVSILPSASDEQVTAPIRPKLLVCGSSNEAERSYSSGVSDDTSDQHEDHINFSPPIRRESQASSTSTASDASSAVTTPSSDDGPTQFWWSPTSNSTLEAKDRFGKNHTRTSMPYLNSDDYGDRLKGSWTCSSDTTSVHSSPLTMRHSVGRRAEIGQEVGSCDAHSPIEKQDHPGLRDIVEAKSIAQSIRQINLNL